MRPVQKEKRCTRSQLVNWVPAEVPNTGKSLYTFIASLAIVFSPNKSAENKVLNIESALHNNLSLKICTSLREKRIQRSCHSNHKKLESNRLYITRLQTSQNPYHWRDIASHLYMWYWKWQYENYLILNSLSHKRGVQGWRNGENTRLPTSGLGSIPSHMWVEFVGSLLCSVGDFSPGTPVFTPPPPKKNTNLSFDLR